MSPSNCQRRFREFYKPCSWACAWLLLASIIGSVFFPEQAQAQESSADERPPSNEVEAGEETSVAPEEANQEPSEGSASEPTDDEQQKTEPTLRKPFLHYGVGFALQTLSRSRTLGYTILEERYQQSFISSVPVFVELVLANRVGLQAEVLFPSRLLFLNPDALAVREHTYALYYKFYLARAFKDAKKPTEGLQSFGLSFYYQRHFGAIYEQLGDDSSVPLNRIAYGAGTTMYINRLGFSIGLGPEIFEAVNESQASEVRHQKTFITMHLNFYWVFSL